MQKPSLPHRRTLRVFWFYVALGLVCFFAIVVVMKPASVPSPGSGRESGSGSTPQGMATTSGTGATPSERAQVAGIRGHPAILSEPPLHLMDGYASSTGTAADDMGIVEDTLRHFLVAVPLARRPPLGTNAEFTRALTGDNFLSVAFIPPDSRSIVNGELTDRWGTPLFFHTVSDYEVEIRSAGPDGKLWTADDLTTDSAARRHYTISK